MASVAQVFNERGDGMVVRGGQAIFDKDDRQPHLNEGDAFKLLRSAVESYQDEHKTSPARIVLHKTSSFSPDEIAGLKAAAETERIEIMDLVWVRRSWLRLYRTKIYPPLRGVWLRLGDREGIVYLRGSVTFFATYRRSCARVTNRCNRTATTRCALAPPSQHYPILPRELLLQS
jgi:hypothetical protein